MQREHISRGQRREDVLATVKDENSQSAGYIAYCLNYNASSVAADLRWLAREGLVRAEEPEDGFVDDDGKHVARLWHITDAGRWHLRLAAIREAARDLAAVAAALSTEESLPEARELIGALDEHMDAIKQQADPESYA